MLEPFLYEAAARLLFAPFGGVQRVRARVIDGSDPRPGSTILEVGCGPGALTRALVARGARVVALDASPAMLRAAGRRAPGATLTLGDARTYEPDRRFDAILLSFVLHELPASDCPSVLRRLANALEPSGRLVISDHATPLASAGRSWRWVLRRIETHAIDEWLDADLPALLGGAGLSPHEDVVLAGGRVRLIVAGRRRS